MKFRVTMKDPDTLGDAIKDAISKQIDELCTELDLDQDEKDSLIERRSEKLSDLCDKWFSYGEYLEVEIDTEAKTCVVVECK